MKRKLPSTMLFHSAVVELHYKRPLFNEMRCITNSKDAESILREFIDLNRIDLKEFFWLLLLSNANRLLAVSEVSSGGTKIAQIQIREIFQLSLEANATNIILAHCHPSGNLKISKADKTLTKKIVELGKLMEIVVLDHLILTSESYVSFADMGEL